MTDAPAPPAAPAVTDHLAAATKRLRKRARAYDTWGRKLGYGEHADDIRLLLSAVAELRRHRDALQAHATANLERARRAEARP